MTNSVDNSTKTVISPLRELWSIAWPTVMTMASYTVMQFVDGLMVSAVGSTELTAQGGGGIFAFLPIAFSMGMLSVVNTFVSQNLGAGSTERSPQYAWTALWLALGISICLVPYGFLLPHFFDHIHSDNPELASLEGMYGQILVFASFFTIGSRALSHFFYGMHRPRVIFTATLIGNTVNIVVNYVLIFGQFGFPELKLLGAAIGTVCGTSVELLIPVLVFLGPKYNREMKTRSAWRPSLYAAKGIFRIGWPKGIQFGNEILCWSIFTVVIIGMFGEVHMAAGWIALKYIHLSFMPAVGISVAITAVVGKYIGANQPDIANKRAWLGVRLAVGYMSLCGLVFVIFRKPLVLAFLAIQSAQADPADAALIAAQTDEIVRVASQILVCAACFQVFDALAISLSGALSGAGDTVWPGVVTFICSWLFIVGLAWLIGHLFPQLGAVGPWIGCACFIISLGIAFVYRWRSGKWRKINLLNPSDKDELLESQTNTLMEAQLNASLEIESPACVTSVSMQSDHDS